VLGCYINPIHGEAAERRLGIERFRDSLALARAFGCGIVATETGSVNADCSFHSDNSLPAAFSALVETLAEIAREAEDRGVDACVEGVWCHVASSPARLKAALDAVGSNRLKVLFDPVNFLGPGNWGEQERMFGEAEALLGDRIAAFHAKDFRVEGGAPRTCPPGTGALDYGRFAALVRRVAPEAPVIIEEVAPADMAAARGFVLARLGADSRGA
jgi:sugar phosphate isomerase/epimerase